MCAREKNVAPVPKPIFGIPGSSSFKAYGDAAAASSQVSMGGGASKARGEGHVRVHYLDGKGVPQRGEGVHAEKIEGWSKEDIKSTSRRSRARERLRVQFVLCVRCCMPCVYRASVFLSPTPSYPLSSSPRYDSRWREGPY